MDYHGTAGTGNPTYSGDAAWYVKTNRTLQMYKTVYHICMHKSTTSCNYSATLKAVALMILFLLLCDLKVRTA